MTIVLANSFIKSLDKTENEYLSSEEKQKIKHELIKQNAYLPNWRKKLEISYNKKNTYRLAKALTAVKPEWSIYQAKIFLTTCNWWDYSWFFNDLIRLFDQVAADKIHKLSEYIYEGGKTRYEKVNTKEYSEALDKWFDKAMELGTRDEDGSFTMGDVEYEGDLAILKHSKEDGEIAKKEIAKETAEMGNIIANWIKNNPKYQPLICTILDVWRRSYNRYCLNADWRKVTTQMRTARQDILNKNWNNLAMQFSELNGWWD